MRLDTDVRGCLTVSCRCRMIGKGDESQTEAGWCVVGHLAQGVKQGSIGGDYLWSAVMVVKVRIQDSKARKTQSATGFQSILDKSKLLDVRSSSWILLNLFSNALKCVRYSTQGARVSSLFRAVSGYLVFAYRYQ